MPNLLQFTLCSQAHIFSLCSFLRFLICLLAVYDSNLSKFEDIIGAFCSLTTLRFLFEFVKIPMEQVGS